jgi:hypothetical protein
MPAYRFVILLARPATGGQFDTMGGVDVQPDDSIQVERRGRSLAAAAFTVIRDLEAVGLRPVRVCDDDWVTLAEVGERIGRSRENVRLWAAARYGPGGFPPPLNPGKQTTFYSWAEVSVWLRQRMGFDLPDCEPVLVAMNLALQVRNLLPRISDADTVRALVGEELLRAGRAELVAEVRAA